MRFPLPPAPKPEDYRDHTTVPCPECKAPMGVPCHRPDSMARGASEAMHIPHSARVQRWLGEGSPKADARQRRLPEAAPSWHEPVGERA